MKSIILAFIICLLPCTAAAEEFVGRGRWVETIRGSAGPLTCHAVEQEGKWKARFTGVFQGAGFDYTVTFTGPPDGLKGTSIIDGIFYTWAGSIQGDVMQGRFNSWAGNPPRKTRDGTFVIKRTTK